MKTGKIILMILIVIVCICLLFHGCCYMIFNAFFNALVESDMSISEGERAQAHRPKEVFGLTTSDYRIIDERDTHQGWLGDGEYYLILDCSQNAERACSIVREWKPLPLSQNLNRALYGEEKDGIKIPYLNGGLFELEATDIPKSVFPADYFADLFDFFNQYNFTIDENDPNDAEVGIDPEMLGRIFENLLEDNKDKGAFYTPKEIVQYMCRESLIAYLQTDAEEESKVSMRKFVTTHEVAELRSAEVFKVDKKLREVKICDPAIGSGAFPMGLLKELFDCRMAIEGSDEGKTPSEIKKDIIQNSIYGVDIEKGAVDIARLRFWLSLIIDEQTPHALPNMDFKIMQGNSLLEQYKLQVWYYSY